MEEIDKLIAQYAYSKDDVYAEKYLKYPIFLDKHKKADFIINLAIWK
ncbi:hypothetical protein [Enterococcus faecium]|nr:hypothetical protein [Enterococcus faecium]